MKKFLAFTMAETIITLSMIGIVAVVTIPSIIHKNTESRHRTMLKKAVEVYSNAIVTITSENSIKANTGALDDWGKTNNCANARDYFKIVDGDGCQFKTADGVWWDFGTNGTLSKALVAFKKADLIKAKAINESTNDAFYFMTQFDNNQKARIIDVGFSNQNGPIANIVNNAKVMAFLNKKNIKDYYIICGSNYKSCFKKDGCNDKSCRLQYFDSNGKSIGERYGCSIDLLINCNSGYSTGPQMTGIKDEQYIYSFGSNCPDAQIENCNKSIFKAPKVIDKTETPKFDVDGDYSYLNLKLDARNTKYTECPDVVIDERDCTGNIAYNDNFRAYELINGKNVQTYWMQVYYYDSDRTKLDTVSITEYKDGKQAVVLSFICNGADNIRNCKCTDLVKSDNHSCP